MQVLCIKNLQYLKQAFKKYIKNFNFTLTDNGLHS